MNRLRIKVNDVSLVLASYDKIKIYRADSQSGNYSEVSDASSRPTIIPEKEIYYYYDTGGTSTHWYKTSYFNSTTLVESSQSSAFQESQYTKTGYSFRNYSPPSTDWGEALTADDIRFTYLWGIDLQGSDVQVSDVDDNQLSFCVDCALQQWEKELNIDIRKKIYKVNPSSSLNRSLVWREGVDYTDEEDMYDFDKIQWQNFGFLQLRHKPLISIETAELYDVIGNKVMDILTWVRMYKKPGQIAIYPKGSFSIGAGYAGTSVFAAYHQMFSANFPQSFKIEYTTGLPSSDFIDGGLRDVIGMTAALIALAWIGDGLMAGFSSSSISLDGLSESFSSTQSATSAYFGARIKDYIDRIDKFRKSNKLKYANISIGFVGS